jgi:DHA1 family tetracycline resistance protein-like MFS transporter
LRPEKDARAREGGGASAEQAMLARAHPLLGGPLSAAALVLGMFTEAVGYGMVAPTLPFMAQKVGAHEGRIGFLVGVYAAVGLFAAIPLGALANRFGRRSLVILGLACLTVASIGFTMAPTYLWLVVARVVQGLGASGVWVGTLTLAADLSPDETMGRSLSWITGAWSLGFILGPAFGGIGTLRTPFLLYAGLSALTLVVVVVGLPEIGRGGPRATFGGILRIFRRSQVLSSGIATFALAFFYGAVEAFLPLLLAGGSAAAAAAAAGGSAAAAEAAPAASRAAIGLLFSVAGLPSVLLPGIAGRLADRHGDVRLIVAGFVFAAALSLTFLPLFGLVPSLVLFFLLGCVEVIVYTPAVALLNRGMPSSDRVFSSASHSYSLVAGLLFPFGGYATMFATLALMSIAAAIVVRRTAPRDPSTPPLADGAPEY